MLAHAHCCISACHYKVTLPCKCCPSLQPGDTYVDACFLLFWRLQDPSYDPFGFAKTATRTASSQAGAAAACPANVQKFFATLFARARSPAGLDLINKDLNLCPESYVDSYTQVNQTLAKYFQDLWVSGVSAICQYPTASHAWHLQHTIWLYLDVNVESSVEVC